MNWLNIIKETARETNAQDDHYQAVQWIIIRLDVIRENLQRDIDQEARGMYPHPGRATHKSNGEITYSLTDKQGHRLDFPASDKMSIGEIEQSTGYHALNSVCDDFGLSLKLNENKIDGDDEVNRYYTITVSGWAV